MPERNANFGGHSSHGFKETVCINCNKIMDSCRDKDCLEDLKVFLTDYSQEILDRATNIRCKDAEILWTHITVEPVPFNRGFFQVDIRFFFRLIFEACVCLGKSQEIEGIAVFDKSVILFGSEGNVSIFKSDPASNNFCAMPNFNAESLQSNLPTAVVEIVDPICLGVKVLEKGKPSNCCCSIEAIPEHICNSVRGQIVEEGHKDLCVTLGIFALIRLERPTQIVVPCSDFCIPEKECVPVGEDDPCKLFKKMKFPLNEFFPPSIGNLSFGEDVNANEARNERPSFSKR